MVQPSPGFVPTMLRGIRVYPNEPLKFDFIVDKGDAALQDQAFKNEAEKLIKYFLASLTIPEKDFWVNLSPYEKDRIVPSALSQTDMGIDLLAQDYILKQITASLVYPENDLGKKFWARVYKQAYEQYGKTDIPIDTFNKVWIVPQKAVVYANGDKVFVTEAKLKVMLESDFVAQQQSRSPELIAHSKTNELSTMNHELTSDIVRDIVLPELEKEVNEGKNFSQLRQIYQVVILAAWFKENLKNSVLNKVYVDKRKVKGLELNGESSFVNRESETSLRDTIHDPRFTSGSSQINPIAQSIYIRYLEAFKKGVCNFIKVEYDKNEKRSIPRKYFSGGTNLELVSSGILQQTNNSRVPLIGDSVLVSVNSTFIGSTQALKPLADLGSSPLSRSSSGIDSQWTSETLNKSLASLLIRSETGSFTSGHFIWPEVNAVVKLINRPLLNKKDILARQRAIDILVQINGGDSKKMGALYDSTKSWIASYQKLLRLEDGPSYQKVMPFEKMVKKGKVTKEGLVAILDGNNSPEEVNDDGRDPLSPEEAYFHLFTIEREKNEINKLIEMTEALDSDVLKGLARELREALALTKVLDAEALIDIAKKEKSSELSELLVQIENILTPALINMGAFMEFARMAKESGFARATCDEAQGESFEAGWLLFDKKSKKEQIKNNSAADVLQVILTGSNMSGKSYYLKTNLLMHMCFQAFGYVPAQKANMNVYDTIAYLDRPSTDSHQNLSAFGKEIKNLVLLERDSGTKKILFIDEGGSTTSPQEQTKLLQAIDGFARENKIKHMVATHNEEYINAVKDLPDTKTHHLGVEIVDNKPVYTYELRAGADDSNAIVVARGQGLPEDFLKIAQSVVDGNPPPITVKIKPVSVAKEKKIPVMKRLFPTAVYVKTVSKDEKKEIVDVDPDTNFMPVFLKLSQDRDFSDHYPTQNKDFDFIVRNHNRTYELIRNFIMESSARSREDFAARQKMFTEILRHGIADQVLKDRDYLSDLFSFLVSNAHSDRSAINITWFKMLAQDVARPGFTEMINSDDIVTAAKFLVLIAEANERLLKTTIKDMGIEQEVNVAREVIDIFSRLSDLRQKSRGASKEAFEAHLAKIKAMDERMRKLSGSTNDYPEKDVAKFLAKTIESAALKAEKTLKPVSLYERSNWQPVKEEVARMFSEVEAHAKRHHYFLNDDFPAEIYNLDTILDSEDHLGALTDLLKKTDSVYLHELADHLEGLITTFLRDIRRGTDYFERTIRKSDALIQKEKDLKTLEILSKELAAPKANLAEIFERREVREMVKDISTPRGENDWYWEAIQTSISHLDLVKKLMNKEIKFGSTFKVELFGKEVSMSVDEAAKNGLMECFKQYIKHLKDMIKYERTNLESHRSGINDGYSYRIKEGVDSELLKLQVIVHLAKLMQNQNWQDATLTDGPDIVIDKGYNLAKEKSAQVPLSIALRQGQGAFFTNTNMSGKTFGEKTIIWNVLCALATGRAPGKISLPLLNHVIYLDRVTRQYDQTLSAFGHEGEYWKILLKAVQDPTSLVILDEPASTTSPKYQKGFDYSLSNAILSQGHFMVMATHHGEFLETMQKINPEFTKLWHYKTHLDEKGEVVFDYLLESGLGEHQGRLVAQALGLDKILKHWPEDNTNSPPAGSSAISSDKARAFLVSEGLNVDKYIDKDFKDIVDAYGYDGFKELFDAARDGKNYGFEASTVFRFALPTLKKIFTPDELRDYWPDIVRIGVAAGKNVRNVLGYGFPAVRKLMVDKPSLNAIGDDLALLCKKNPRHRSVEFFFKNGLFKLVKTLTTEQFKASWPNIIKLNAAVEGESTKFLEDTLPSIKKLFTAREFDLYLPIILRLAAALGKDVNNLDEGIATIRDIIMDEVSFNEAGDHLVRLITSMRREKDNDVVFLIGKEFDAIPFSGAFTAVKKLFTTEEFKAYWPTLVDIAIKAGRNAPGVLKFGLPVVRYMIVDKTSLASVGSDLARIGSKEESRFSSSFFNQYLPELKKTFGPEGLAFYWSGFAGLCEASEGQESNIAKSLIIMESAFGDKKMRTYWPELVRLGLASKKKSWLFVNLLSDFSFLISDDISFKSVGDDLARLIIDADEKAEILFKNGLTAAKGLITDQKTLNLIGNDLVRLGEAAGEKTRDLCYGLLTIRKLFTLKEFESYWPGIVRLGVAYGDDSVDLSRDLETVKEFFTPEEFKAYWLDIVTWLIGSQEGGASANIFHALQKFNKTSFQNKGFQAKVNDFLATAKNNPQVLNYSYQILTFIFDNRMPLFVQFIVKSTNEKLVEALNDFFSSIYKNEISLDARTFIFDHFMNDVSRDEQLSFLREMTAWNNSQIMADHSVEDWKVFLKGYYKDFGPLISKDLFKVYVHLVNSRPLNAKEIKSYELSKLLTQTGPQGIDELKQKTQHIWESIFDHESISEDIASQPLLNSLAIWILRFSQGEWSHGISHRIEFSEFISEFQRIVSQNPSFLKVDETIRHNTAADIAIHKMGTINFEIDEKEAFDKYCLLFQEALEILKQNKEEDVFSLMHARWVQYLAVNENLFKDNLSKLKNPQGIDQLTKKINHLKALRSQIEAAKDFIALEEAMIFEGNGFLVKDSEFVRNFSLSLVLDALIKYSTQREKIEEVLARGLSVSAFAAILTFKENLLKDHILQDSIKKSEVLSIFRTQSFKKALMRREQLQDTLRITFRPITKGLFLALAGSFGNACYTRMATEDILGHRSMVGVIPLTGNIGSGEQILGSIIVLQETIKNEKIWLLRAINPIEYIADNYNMDDFMVEAIKTVRKRLPKDVAGLYLTLEPGTTSNRPQIGSASKKFANPKSKKLDSAEGFNGYSISNVHEAVVSQGATVLTSVSSSAVKVDEAVKELFYFVRLYASQNKPFLMGTNFIDTVESELPDRPGQWAEALRKIYATNPDLAGVLFMSTASAGQKRENWFYASFHGEWKAMVRELVKDPQGWEMLWDMLNRGLEHYRLGTPVQHEGSELPIEYSFGTLGGLPVYLENETEGITQEIVRGIKKENLSTFLDAVILFSKYGVDTLADKTKELLKEYFVSEVARAIVPSLDPECQEWIEERDIIPPRNDEMRRKKVVDGLFNYIEDSHWEDTLRLGQHFMELLMSFLPENPKQWAEVLREIYKKNPDVAGALFVSAGTGFGNDWAEWFDSSHHGQWAAMAQALTETSGGWDMLIDMLNRGLDCYQNSERFTHDRREFRIRGNFGVLGGMPSYWQALREGIMVELVNAVSEKNRPVLLNAIILFSNYRQDTSHGKITLSFLREYFSKEENRKIIPSLYGDCETWLDMQNIAIEKPASPGDALNRQKVIDSVFFIFEDPDKSYDPSDHLAFGETFMANAMIYSREKPKEWAETLKEIYEKSPDVAGVILTSAGGYAPGRTILGSPEGRAHGAWSATIRELAQDPDNWEMLIDMFNRGFDQYRRNVPVTYDGKEVVVDYGLGSLGCLPVYLEGSSKWITDKIIEDIDKDNLPSFFDAVAIFTKSTNVQHREQSEKILKKYFSGMKDAQSVIERLDPEYRKWLEGQKLIPTGFGAKETVRPAFWDDAWGIPTDEEKIVAEKVMKKLFTGSYAIDFGLTFCNLYEGHTSEKDSDGWFRKPEKALRVLRAMYFLYPEITPLLLSSRDIGSHGSWKELFEAANPQTVDMLIFMINHGLNDYRNRRPNEGVKRITFDGQEYGINFEFKMLGGLFAYLDEKLALVAAEGIKEEFRQYIVPEIVSYYRLWAGKGHEAKTKVILQSPAFRDYVTWSFNGPSFVDQGESVSSDKNEIKDTHSKTRPEGIHPGEGLGKLVIVPDNATLDDLKNISKDSIVIMKTLWTSDMDVGPFRGMIITGEQTKGDHSVSRCEAWQSPLMFYPKADQVFKHLAGKNIYYSVSQKGIIVRSATFDDITRMKPRMEAKDKAREGRVIEVPGALLGGEGKGEGLLFGQDQRLQDPRRVGHKAALLNMLADVKFETGSNKVLAHIAGGQAWPFSVFAGFLREKDLMDDYEQKVFELTLALVNSKYSFEKQCAALQAWLKENLRESVRVLLKEDADFLNVLEDFINNGGFVRGSMTTENPPEAPFLGSGIYKTVQNVKGTDNVVEAILDVYASLWSPEAVRERFAYRIDQEKAWPAIWFNESEKTDYSFVLHTTDKVDAGRFTAEIVPGYGQAIVSREIPGAPTEIELDKISAKVLRAEKSTMKQKIVLDDKQGGTKIVKRKRSEEFLRQKDKNILTEALFRVGTQAEKFFKSPVEIEGTLSYDKHSKTWEIALRQVRHIYNPATVVASSALVLKDDELKERIAAFIFENYGPWTIPQIGKKLDVERQNLYPLKDFIIEKVNERNELSGAPFVLKENLTTAEIESKIKKYLETATGDIKIRDISKKEGIPVVTLYKYLDLIRQQISEINKSRKSEKQLILQKATVSFSNFKAIKEFCASLTQPRPYSFKELATGAGISEDAIGSYAHFISRQLEEKNAALGLGLRDPRFVIKEINEKIIKFCQEIAVERRKYSVNDIAVAAGLEPAVVRLYWDLISDQFDQRNARLNIGEADKARFGIIKYTPSEEIKQRIENYFKTAQGGERKVRDAAADMRISVSVFYQYWDFIETQINLRNRDLKELGELPIRLKLYLGSLEARDKIRAFCNRLTDVRLYSLREIAEATGILENSLWKFYKSYIFEQFERRNKNGHHGAAGPHFGLKQNRPSGESGQMSDEDLVQFLDQWCPAPGKYTVSYLAEKAGVNEAIFDSAYGKSVVAYFNKKISELQLSSADPRFEYVFDWEIRSSGKKEDLAVSREKDQAVMTAEREEIERIAVVMRDPDHGQLMHVLSEGEGRIGFVLRDFYGDLTKKRPENFSVNKAALEEILDRVSKMKSYDRQETLVRLFRGDFVERSRQGKTDLRESEEIIKETEEFLKSLKAEKASLERVIEKTTECQSFIDAMDAELVYTVSDSLHSALIGFDLLITGIESILEVFYGKVSRTSFYLKEVIDNFKVKIESDLPDDFVLIGNKFNVRSAIYNLINNAQKAAEDNEKKKGGNFERQVILKLSEAQGMLKITVVDNGAGIRKDLLEENPKTKRQRLFDLNVSTKGDSRGVGTTQAYYVVKDMGGTITAENIVDEKGDVHGARFIIRLPVAVSSSSVDNVYGKKFIEKFAASDPRSRQSVLERAREQKGTDMFIAFDESKFSSIFVLANIYSNDIHKSYLNGTMAWWLSQEYYEQHAISKAQYDEISLSIDKAVEATRFQGSVHALTKKWENGFTDETRLAAEVDVQRLLAAREDHLVAIKHLEAEIHRIAPDLELLIDAARRSYAMTEEFFNDLENLALRQGIQKSSSGIALQNPGGIDFGADKLNIETRSTSSGQAKGQGIDFVLPPELQGIDLNSIEGLTPVIINIVPIMNFPGYVKGEEINAPVASAQAPQELSEAKELEAVEAALL